ncbi:MAG TPA: methyltransferase [Rhizomicrobium sp.]|nr:methyltransferase [Rhizomicrobium sp.]
MTDRFLNGRVVARQPDSGFRSGLDAVMLAAAVPARAGDTVLELGAGAGTASLCLAARVPDCEIVGIEIDPGQAALARENASANGARAEFVAADIFDLPAALKRDFAHVFCNPPFHDGEASPDPARDIALRDDGRLADWLALGLKRTVSGGSFTAILRADRLGEAMAALPARGVTVFPLWPRDGVAAKRVIVQAVKGAGHALALSSGLVLHHADGRYTAAADAVLRDASPLSLR